MAMRLSLGLFSDTGFSNPAFSPASLEGLSVWLDGSNPANTGSEIVDRSGNGNDTSSGATTVSNAQNGLPALSVGPAVVTIANNAALQAINDEITIFYAHKFDPSANFLTSIYRKWPGTNGGWFVQNDSNGNGYWNTRTSGGNGIAPETSGLRPAIFSNTVIQGNVRLDNGNYSLRHQKSVVQEGTYPHGTGFGNTADIRLFDQVNNGVDDALFFELMIYDRSLSDAEVLQVENYITDKWAI